MSNNNKKCPTCDSPDPARHPAMQYGGEVQVCKDPWHAPLDNPVPTELETLRADLATAARALVEREAECERWKQAALNVGRDAASAQTERDTLRAQLIEAQQDLREEEKRHRKAAVDRDEFAAKLHLADQDRQILSDCRAALHAQLAERDAEIGRLRACLDECARAGCPTAADMNGVE